uniref:Capsular polysaccharide transport system ATP-binding protein n=1 Tax=Candidatus Kentrum sp. DK TaxID=2126562 RepID=A0A450S9I2_9GAMM|nr:MAG: capsular polysaccharide transport system ATP-binding protein [Candidatus Kentron sp. DK]
MIEIIDVTKVYPTRDGVHTVLDGINLTIHPGEKIGILGRNGAGKSTLVRILGGAERPTHGRIRRGMSLSWPLAFGGAFQGSLTGLDNLKFICRVYGADYRDKIDYVQDFAELGEYFREPIKSYSSGMRSRLAFAISMSIEFDCFLIDEILAVGDARFHEKCRIELFEKRRDRAFVMVSHQAKNIHKYCDRAAVLHEGRMHVFDDVDTAYGFYQEVET